jgi:hypothetical protein
MTDTPSADVEKTLSREFLLAAACSIWPNSEKRSTAIAQAAAATIDWGRFARIVRRHRIVGLAQDGLKRAGQSVPAETAQFLATATAEQLRLNLLFAAETVRLQQAFERNSMAVTFFKGIPTAIDIYGELGLRHSKDLDLLVSPSLMPASEAILFAAGYRRTAPPPDLDPARLHTLTTMGKDFVYARNDNPSVEVELHWRLFNNAKFMDKVGEPATRVFPDLSNVRLRVLSGDSQFAYLCAHGAAFAWCRLKWLADIGGLLAREKPEGVVRLYEAAAGLGAARPAAQAILLCQRLLGTDVPGELLEQLRANAAVRKLERLALNAMLQGGAEAEPYDLPGGMAPIAKSLWMLGGTPRYLWGELNSRWISWDDVIEVPLPPRLQFLYPLLRLPRWLMRRSPLRRRLFGARPDAVPPIA